MLVILLLFTIWLTFRSLCRFLHFNAEQQADKDVAPANSKPSAIVQTKPGGGDDPAVM